MVKARKRPVSQLFFLLLMMAVLVVACSNEQPGSGQQGTGPQETSDPGSTADGSSESKKIKIGYLNVMDDAQALLAYDGGYYKEAGLDAEMVQFSSGTDLIKAIVGGQLDAGVLGFTNAVTWVSQGADLKVVGGAQLGFHSILVDKDSDIESVADLKGRTLASQKQGSTADVVLNGVVLAEENLTRDDLNMVYVEPQNAIQSLHAGQVDAAFVFEPFDKIAQLQFEAKQIYEIGKVWPFPCMVVITSAEVLEKDRDMIDRMLDAQKEAIDVLENNSQEAAEILTPRFIGGETLETPNGSVSAVEVIKESIDSQVFNWELTQDQIDRMQEISDIMLEQGSLETPVNVQDLLDLTWQNNIKN